MSDIGTPGTKPIKQGLRYIDRVVLQSEKQGAFGVEGGGEKGPGMVGCIVHVSNKGRGRMIT